MTGLLIALGIIAVTAMGVACVALEIRLAQREHPARFFLCWAAWCAPTTTAGALLIPGAGLAADEALLLGLMAGVIGYPVLWVRFRLSDWRYGGAAREQALERERMTYRATDFGGTAPAPAAAAAGLSTFAARRPPAPARASPLVAQPADSALARAVADTRPRWARAAEQGLVAVVCVIGIVAWLGYIVADGADFDDRGAPEAVGELLELHGFAAPKIERQWLTIRCRFDSFAYRWSAMGAEGLACVQKDDGEIRVQIDRSWGKLPTVAFERMAVRPMESATVEALTPDQLRRADDPASSDLMTPPASP